MGVGYLSFRLFEIGFEWEGKHSWHFFQFHIDIIQRDSRPKYMWRRPPHPDLNGAEAPIILGEIDRTTTRRAPRVKERDVRPSVARRPAVSHSIRRALQMKSKWNGMVGFSSAVLSGISLSHTHKNNGAKLSLRSSGSHVADVPRGDPRGRAAGAAIDLSSEGEGGRQNMLKTWLKG